MTWQQTEKKLRERVQKLDASLTEREIDLYLEASWDCPSCDSYTWSEEKLQAYLKVRELLYPGAVEPMIVRTERP